MDVLGAMLNRQHELTAMDYEEFGRPDDPEELEVLRRVCPYTSLSERGLPPGARLPPVLISADLSDNRVEPSGPLKFAALLRKSAADTGQMHQGPVVVDLTEGAGHYGYQGRITGYNEEAADAAFLLTYVGTRNSTKA